MSQIPSSPTFNGFAASGGGGGGNPLANLQTDIQFASGGNPLLASMGGTAGLATDYGNSYASALKANQQNYTNIVKSYGSLLGNIGGILGQGGTGWGVAGPAAQAIADTQAQQTGGAIQNSINRGVGSTTAATAAQRGANFDAQKAYAGLGAQLGQTYAGYTSGLGQGLLGVMNSVQSPYPTAGAYNQLYGSQQALQQAQLDRQTGLGTAAAGRFMSSIPSGGGIMQGGAGARSGISSPFTGSSPTAPLPASELGYQANTTPMNFALTQPGYGGQVPWFGGYAQDQSMNGEVSSNPFGFDSGIYGSYA